MNTIENTVLKYQDIIKQELAVNNASLLKTGALSTIINMFSNIKYDNMIMYNKLLRELNPSTLTEFSSLLLHSSLLNQPVAFATPAKATFSILVPDTIVKKGTVEIIEISKDIEINTTNGISYTLEKDIKIYKTDGSIYAKSFGEGKVDILEIDKIQDPQDPQRLINFIRVQNVVQYKRTLELQRIPSFPFGTNYSFSIPISNIKDVYSIKAFIYRSGSEEKSMEISYNDFLKYTVDELHEIFNMEKLDIEYSKFNSTQFDKAIYLSVKDNNLVFDVGNGLVGDKLKFGDKVYIDLKTTQGYRGNVGNLEVNLENIPISVKNDDDTVIAFYKTNLKMISIDGGKYGKDISSMPELRKELVNRSNETNSLITLNDFQTFYTKGRHAPFVDTKFFNSQNHINVYSVMKDGFDNVIYTTTFNEDKELFLTNTFFPTRNYAEIDLISPFYYKEFKNFFISYIINPKIIIDTYVDEIETSLIETQNLIETQLLYDYTNKKSSIKIRNANNNYVYRITSNLFTMELSKYNSFQEVINQRFLDEYCLLDEKLKDIRIEIMDKSGQLIKTLLCDEEYFQLEELQRHYYYLKLSPFDSSAESKIIIGVPYIDAKYVNSTNPLTLYNKIKDFFNVDSSQDKIAFNVRVTQSLFNTIKIDPIYKDYIVRKSSNMDLLDTKNFIYIKILLDTQKYTLSKFENLAEFKFEIKNSIIKYLKTIEGFETSFYETNIESALKKEHDMITNIDMITPKVFEINNSSIIYNAIEEDIGEASDTDMFTLLNFIPPYFYFDFKNMQIDIELI